MGANWSAPEARAGRRRFLGGAAGALALLVPAQAVWARPLPARERGAARIDVRAHGARGDGVRDDTAAFQAAIDALPPDGGVVQVPAGDYLIDPVRGVQLRGRMHLQLAAGARLRARPNAAERAYVLNVEGVEQVEISGGEIVGERDRHLGTSGEWGHGIMIRGSTGVTVHDMRLSKCWGDGISIGGQSGRGRPVRPSRDVVIANVVCLGNRRQGLTIGRSRQVRVYDSEFSETYGTLPACGIDVEPDAGDITEDVLIENCRARANQGAGIQLYKRVSRAIVRDCEIAGNRGYGIAVIGAADCVLDGNHIRDNGLAGVGVRPGSRGIEIKGNRFAGNAAQRRRNATRAAAAPRVRHVSVAKGVPAVRIGDDNRFAD
ncbi:right-handed parallel beta-helix repeat-containing protein [Vulcaniibacterium tengchongense]|uniref:Pectate lyase-like protein n=1 Tax=Vulcaniibacterium tengchongense TaxID=1273429 RepID=A0A3N4VIY4_9GAMM|nr:right-handed parallel beta-helix repeat-containing protein [Vulcaniibacterium tengchongense]RPE81653.1 pectate lyase-like protein [Vulcaniibacterium tengchongense]